MPGHSHGKSIKNPRVYEALKRRGYSKSKSAAISNAMRGRGGSSKRGKGGKRK